ncbi:MAG TPA: RluA family pseudouridine synthase [Acidimicrobiia bacterium]|nr:RluA family pseudouridine synthase [Acidimicrobiia bacterium]
MGDRLTFTVPDDLAGERADRVVAVMGEMSRAAARQLVDEGSVTVDGEKAAARSRLEVGQVISFPPPAEAAGLEPVEVDFGVAYEDEDLIVVDKPAGLVVHPGAAGETGTVAAGILHRRPEVEGVGQEGRWGLVHRLDRDTSGLMVVAISDRAYRGLAEQVSEREMGREYLALVDGGFPVPTGTIDAPLSRDAARPTRRRVDPAGRPARTHYEVEHEYENSGLTLLRVRLETGRTHQIRVHLAAIGHPLVGDRVYRPGPDRVEVPRLFLHAARLSFTHPASGEPLAFDSPLPPELSAVLERLS